MKFSNCSVCGVQVIDSGNGRNLPRGKRRCMDCIRAANYRNCFHCGKRFYVNRKDRRFCSPQCWNGWKSANRDELSAARRRAKRKALKINAFVELVDPRRVFERDSYRCWICEGEILPGHPRWSPSVDHVVPLSLGGLHSYANVRTAHLFCNHVKGARYWPPEPLDPLLKPYAPEEY